jgi:hypothetical protein
MLMREILETTNGPLVLPPEPGTEPIKPGYVRLYHQTDRANIEEIKRHGIQLSKARGIEGPRAIWAGETPFYGPATKIPTIEFQVPRENWDSPFVLQDQVTTDEFIAVHEPWHKHARYILSHPDILEKTLDGEFDDLSDDYVPAIKYIKDTHGK